MQFILDSQARTEAILMGLAERHQEWEKRQAVSEKRLDRLERVVARMARIGLGWRNALKKQIQEHDRVLAQVDQNLRECSDKLNGLIGYVDGPHRDEPQN